MTIYVETSGIFLGFLLHPLGLGCYFISLTPKGTHFDSPYDFHPILRYNEAYIIISKLITNRLKPPLPTFNFIGNITTQKIGKS